MKNMRKLLSIILALAMIFTLTASVLADTDSESTNPTTYTIKIKGDKTGHTYEAFQIFTGDLSGDEDSGYVLSNIEWGTGVKSDGLVSALKKASKVSTSALYGEFPSEDSDGDTISYSASDIAEILAKFSSSSDAAKEFAQLAYDYKDTVAKTSKADAEDGTKYTISGLSAGYYLVIDKDNSVTAAGDAYTDVILEVVSDVEVDVKAEYPSLEKGIDDINDSTDDSAATSKNDSADYDIGDDVPFTLTATLPSNYSDFDSYTVIFHDTMSNGLSFNSDSVTVKIDGTSLDSNDYSVVTDTKHYTAVTITSFDSRYTYYTYNSDANSYKEVNSSAAFDDSETYYLLCTFEVKIDDLAYLSTDGVNVTDSSIIVVTYTAKLTANAAYMEENDAYLEYSNNPNNTSETGDTPNDITTVFTYTLTVNKVDENGDALANAGFTLYKKNGDEYVAVGIEVTVTAVNDTDDITVLSYTANWSGLDDGEYKLVESTTPTGYNTIDDQYFTIEATHEEGKVTALTIKDADGNEISGTDGSFSTNASTGVISTDITNNSGSELPSTGGIGTTVFYVVGGVLILGAVVLLITKKRMNNEEK